MFWVRVSRNVGTSISDCDAFSQVAVEILEHAVGLLCFSEVALIFPYIVVFCVLAPLFMYEIGQMSEAFECLHHD